MTRIIIVFTFVQFKKEDEEIYIKFLKSIKLEEIRSGCNIPQN